MHQATPAATKKTPRNFRGVFFSACLLLGLAATPATTLADCVLGEADEVVALQKVVDGDTLRLTDGRRVRLIGVNTPELARGKHRAQPLAEESREFVQRFLAGGDLELVYDRDRYDNHGRVLAHVYNHRGDSLESALLAAGLAFHIAVAPNVALAECLSSREDEARLRQRGVWQPGVWPTIQAAEVRAGDGGFVLLTGTVKKVHKNRYIWLDLDGPVALRVDPRGAPRMSRRNDWNGRRLMVRGWLVDRGADYVRKNPGHKRWFLAVDSAQTVDLLRD
ncbi:thermonuclease family protein [Microbulbifer elongatus]|uniref:Thermonuclease family protein n=1 Tax=Microbulbifer elongatus TaxID=86173 RepID=A0ABT1P1S5_9GAMM|nr:thermonuclease family protein [Microbulbifer elongatus]MCQ3830065.1 thermonuclease family protein [Microbulbifer elongatus]